jgi:hypothetical protein
MKNKRVIQTIAGVVVGIILSGGVIWLVNDELKSGSAPIKPAARGGEANAVPPDKPALELAQADLGMPLVAPRKTPLDPAQAQGKEDALSQRRKRYQNRSVPLAQLPPEISQKAVRTLVAPPMARGGGAGRGFAANVAPPRVEMTAPGPKLDDPLASARTKLLKDEALTEWFDQWQADHAAERETTTARVKELEGLLAKSAVGVDELFAVATAVAAAEGGGTAVSRAWYAAAVDRAERDVKAKPGDEVSRRKLDEIRGAAEKSAFGRKP